MARRTWNRCACGIKLHAKKGAKKCYRCSKKEK